MNFLSSCVTKFGRIGPKYSYHWSYIQKRQNNNQSNDMNIKVNEISNKSEECLIYNGSEQMIKMIKMIKRFSISTTLIACGVQPFIFQQIVASSSSFAIGFASITSCGIVLSPVLLNWFTKRYVSQLYYNYETKVFTAWVLNLFNRRVSISYKAEDVKIPQVLGIFTTFTIGPKERPLFVDPESVIDFNAYKIMLGFDKPFDMKLENIMNDKNQTKPK